MIRPGSRDCGTTGLQTPESGLRDAFSASRSGLRDARYASRKGLRDVGSLAHAFLSHVVVAGC